jgi:hypothetical protein
VNVSGESPITFADGWFVGEDQSLRWTIYDRDPATETSPSTAKDITGWTIQFKMSLTEGGASVLTKSASQPYPESASGITTVSTLAADTAGLTAATYHYTLSRTDSGFNQVLAWGTAVLRGRPT